MCDSALPERLQTFRLADERLAEGYEATPPRVRAAVKTTLALTRFLHAERPTRQEARVEAAFAGFGREERRTPAPWLLIVLDRAFAAPTRLAALIMTARLAGVDEVIAVRPQGAAAPPAPFPAALLAALELSGVETVLEMPEAELAPLVRALATQNADQSAGRGRLALFVTAPPGAGHGHEALLHEAEHLDVPTWTERPPRLCITSDAGVDRALVRAAHPDAVLLTPEDPHEGRASPVDAVIGQPVPEGLAAALHLAGDLAACWRIRGLEPDFFSEIACRLYPVTPASSEEPA